MKENSLRIKRSIDVLVSFILLMILSPLLIITSLLILFTMPGPIFFMQNRIGYKGQPYSIFKFRSMKVDSEAESKFEFDKDIERLTAFGKLIRRLKIDELPQLLNVLKGDMSLVGPRPAIEQHTKLYTDYQKQRLNMKPGMTGLAQVNGNASLTWDERIEYDIKYIQKFSLFLDFRILLKTFLIVLMGEERFKK